MENREVKSDNLPEMDRDGYLVDTQKWTKEIAAILARAEIEQELTEDHWRVIDFLRQYYLEWESAPPVRMVVRRTGLPLRDLTDSDDILERMRAALPTQGFRGGTKGDNCEQAKTIPGKLGLCIWAL